MAKYMVLYRSSATAAEQMAAGDPEQMAAGMALWDRWRQKAGDAVVDLGAPLAEGEVLPDGTGATPGHHIAGFSILESRSVEELRTLLQDHPHFHSPGASIEVLEFLPVPAM